MTDDSLRNPELLLSLSYAPVAARPALAVLWRLDEVMASIVQTTSEPMIGQMRLTWWHDAISALKTALPPAEPLLGDIASVLIPQGVASEQLLPIVEGWETLLDPLPWDEGQLGTYALGRGGGVFQSGTSLLGESMSTSLLAAGRGWALADLAFHCSDRATAETALRMARIELAQAPSHWPAPLRTIGVLVVLAARDVKFGLDRDRSIGSPARIMRALAHRITGR